MNEMHGGRGQGPYPPPIVNFRIVKETATPRFLIRKENGKIQNQEGNKLL